MRSWRDARATCAQAIDPWWTVVAAVTVATRPAMEEHLDGPLAASRTTPAIVQGQSTTRGAGRTRPVGGCATLTARAAIHHWRGSAASASLKRLLGRIAAAALSWSGW